MVAPDRSVILPKPAGAVTITSLPRRAARITSPRTGFAWRCPNVDTLFWMDAASRDGCCYIVGKDPLSLLTPRAYTTLPSLCHCIHTAGRTVQHYNCVKEPQYTVL